MSHKTVDQIPIPEKSTPPLKIGPLKDENGAIVKGSDLTTCTLTIFNRGTEDQVKAATDVKSLVGEDGILNYQPVVGDTAIVDAKSRQEWRVARADYTWLSGARSWRHELHFCVANLARLS
jgi:hypothetical protein